MKFFRFLIRKSENNKNSQDSKDIRLSSVEAQDDLIKTGREQFKKLVERGTDLPVVLL